MSNQANVGSVDALKDFRVALALFGEETLAALGAVDFEARRAQQWLQHDRRMYWQEQIKRRREQVAMAKAEVFRRKLAKTPDYNPAFTEQKELLRKAEASLHDAEKRAEMCKKWEPALQRAIQEMHAGTRRIKNIASGDVPRALALMERLIDAVEAYLRVAPPSGAGVSAQSPIESVADPILAADAATPIAEDDGDATAAEEAGATADEGPDVAPDLEEPAPPA